MKIWLLILIIFSSLALGVNHAQACSCIQPAGVLESLEQATAVFSGEVIEIKEPKNIFTDSSNPLTVTFSLSRTWKGPDYKTLKVHTPISSASCGYTFVVGQEYLVYTSGTEGYLEVSLCSRTRIISEAANDFSDLGPGEFPTALNNQTNDYLAGQSLAIILVVIILWIVIVKKMKKNKLNK